MNLEPCKLSISPISDDDFLKLNTAGQIRYLQLVREQVSPIFDEWRNPHRIKCAYGGRGAGAKSMSAGSLLIQFAENPRYFGDSIRVLCVRDTQKAIAQSSWQTLKDELERLEYQGWTVTQNQITNTKNGSYFVFNGLNDLAASDLKSYKDFDILFAEEGAPISKDAWNLILPTFRKEKSEIWVLFNRTLGRDPCYEMFCVNPEPSWSILACRPGRLDNPWWHLTTLRSEWDRLKLVDPEEAAHVYEGLPRPQGDRSVFSQARVLAMFGREVIPEGAIGIGCDVARFGKDKTEAFKRHGHCVIDHRSVHGFDTVAVAGMLWDMAGKDPRIPIKVDSGYNPGVIDMLSSWGANVMSIGFGEKPQDKNAFANAATEMFFNLPVDLISIPEEYRTNSLIEDLTERYYVYETSGQKKIEPKDGTSVVDGQSKSNFKARHGGRSPDEGDALQLCFYERVYNWAVN